MQDSDGPVAEWHLWLERLKFLRAGDGDRTRDKSLEGSHVTATPHPQGDSGRIRTYDRLLRRQLLYPSELLSHE